MKVFALAERYLGNNLDLLTSALLEETLSNLAENERQKFYQRLAERMAQKIRTAIFGKRFQFLLGATTANLNNPPAL